MTRQAPHTLKSQHLLGEVIPDNALWKRAAGRGYMAPYMGNAQGAPALCSLSFPSLDLGKEGRGYRDWLWGSWRNSGVRVRARKTLPNGLELSLPLGSHPLLTPLPVSGGEEKEPRMTHCGDLSSWIPYFFLLCCA